MIWRSITSVRTSTAHSLKRQRRATDAQRFAFEVRYDVLTADQYRDIWGFLVQQQVQFDTFDYTLPSPYDDLELGDPSGSQLVNGASQTGSALVTDGWSGSGVRVGDIWQPTNHKKIYQITANGTPSGGNLTLNFEPPLLQSPANNEALVLSGIKARVSLLNPRELVTPERNSPLFRNLRFQFIEDGVD